MPESKRMVRVVYWPELMVVLMGVERGSVAPLGLAA